MFTASSAAIAELCPPATTPLSIDVRLRQRMQWLTAGFAGQKVIKSRQMTGGYGANSGQQAPLQQCLVCNFLNAAVLQGSLFLQ